MKKQGYLYWGNVPDNGIIGLDRISTIKSEYLSEEICELREEELKKVKEVLHKLLL